MEQVICLGGNWKRFPKDSEINSYPVKDAVYTIHKRSIFHHEGQDFEMLSFEEIVFLNPKATNRPCFIATKFRPVKTYSIQIFKDMLKVNGT